MTDKIRSAIESLPQVGELIQSLSKIDKTSNEIISIVFELMEENRRLKNELLDSREKASEFIDFKLSLPEINQDKMKNKKVVLYLLKMLDIEAIENRIDFDAFNTGSFTLESLKLDFKQAKDIVNKIIHLVNEE